MWLSVWSEVQIVCIWSSWCHCHPQTPSSLASFKSRLVLPFWYQLTQVVLEKRPLNSSSSSIYWPHFCICNNNKISTNKPLSSVTARDSLLKPRPLGPPTTLQIHRQQITSVLCMASELRHVKSTTTMDVIVRWCSVLFGHDTAPQQKLQCENWRRSNHISVCTCTDSSSYTDCNNSNSNNNNSSGVMIPANDITRWQQHNIIRYAF